jgi:multidrug efflux pump subunit AcrB
MPSALGSGLGSETRRRIGITPTVGIGILGLMTFFVLPAVFFPFDRKKFRRHETIDGQASRPLN